MKTKGMQDRPTPFVDFLQGFYLDWINGSGRVYFVGFGVFARHTQQAADQHPGIVFDGVTEMFTVVGNDGFGTFFTGESEF
jgi:hypothetical protein